jgi:hypothetical protein
MDLSQLAGANPNDLLAAKTKKVSIIPICKQIRNESRHSMQNESIHQMVCDSKAGDECIECVGAKAQLLALLARGSRCSCTSLFSMTCCWDGPTASAASYLRRQPRLSASDVR